ncbi:MAG: toll/interleukin-1 receptor domain-containing protein [Bacteroidaceae bacterium]|nr:toll/interleukin-1 receptor domain-containing protein [Bacteroidaceae bacterium]
MEQTYKYFAFISYNSKDTAWGKRVQQKLEHYRMPATLCSEHGWSRTPIKPVFFAPTDIQPGGLSEELQERLRASRNLIVICSPNSAKSEWVGKEIAFFHELGRTKQIHFFIVEGEPHSGNEDTECFNPVVDTLGLPEILGANIHEQTQTYPFTNIPCPWLNKQRAYVQLISKLLGVEFDAIWQRHKRLLVQKAIVWVVGIIAVVAAIVGVWISGRPVNVELKLNEVSVHNENLPPLKDAVVTITLDNESKTDTIHSIDGSATFTNIPHHYLNQEVRMTFACQNFMNLDTTLTLTPNVVLNIHRNPSVYGNVCFSLWDSVHSQYLKNTTVKVDGRAVTSDEEGKVSLFIPLEEQQKSYAVTATTPLINDSIHLPCGPDDAVSVGEQK